MKLSTGAGAPAAARTDQIAGREHAPELDSRGRGRLVGEEGVEVVLLPVVFGGRRGGSPGSAAPSPPVARRGRHDTPFSLPEKFPPFTSHDDGPVPATGLRRGARGLLCDGDGGGGPVRGGCRRRVRRQGPAAL
jgi:hypothetical protein